MCINCKIQPTPAQDVALTRRRMLGLGAAGMAGAAITTLGPVTRAAAAPGSLQSRDREEHGQRRIPVDSISIQLYTLASLISTDLDGTLDGLAQIGFTKVEHAGIPAGLTATQFHDTLRRHGLHSTSGHNPGPSDPFDPVAWSMVLEDANTLGQRTVNWSAPGLKGFDPATGLVVFETAAEWLHLCEILNRAGAMAHDAGLGFGLHNHFWEFLPLKGSPLVGSDILLAETDPRYVHFEIDLFWAWYGHHDPAQLVTFAQDRVSQFHVKDMVLSATPALFFMKDYTFTDPGTGIIDFNRIFAAKTASPRSTEYIIERDDAGANAMNTARVGFNFLKNVRF
jgi:sugar phosphate isomerase/epimerase